MSGATFLLLGVLLWLIGWHRLGISQGRSTALGSGAAGLLLGGLVAFQFQRAAATPAWVFAAMGFVLAGIVVVTASHEEVEEQTFGLYNLLFAVASVLVLVADFLPVSINILEVLAAAVLAIVFTLLFLSGVMPRRTSFRRFTGWITMVGGFVTAVVGLLPLLGMKF